MSTRPNVTISLSYDDCDQCGGGEIITVLIQRDDVEVTVTGGGCFGINYEELISDAIVEWEKATQQGVRQ